MKPTKTLLTYGIVAGPLFVIAGLVQMAIRPGFDITRHPLSLLANGDLGWIQTLNFLATGVLLITGAVGVKRALQSGPGGRWAPLMLGLYGLSLIGGGIFRADPALGFPPGTPLENNPISWHGMLHFVVGTVGFIGFVAACFIFARRFKFLRQPGWAWCSVITGVLFLAAFVGIASGSKGPVSAFFAIAVVVGFIWISSVLSRLKAELVQ
ncbi:MAG: DUF998 domain-containing protein [Armatimonadota bacterium]